MMTRMQPEMNEMYWLKEARLAKQCAGRETNGYHEVDLIFSVYDRRADVYLNNLAPVSWENS